MNVINIDIDSLTVEQLAYWFWEQRGSPIGSPDEDWARAEEQLRINDWRINPSSDAYPSTPVGSDREHDERAVERIGDDLEIPARVTTRERA